MESTFFLGFFIKCEPF